MRGNCDCNYGPSARMVRTLGDGPSVDEENRLFYQSMGMEPPPAYVDPWGSPLTPPPMLDSELMATAAGEDYRQFFRENIAPRQIDTELTAMINEQRDFYSRMPASAMFPGPVQPTILYRPEDAAARPIVETGVVTLVPSVLDQRTTAPGYPVASMPSDGYGPPTPTPAFLEQQPVVTPPSGGSGFVPAPNRPGIWLDDGQGGMVFVPTDVTINQPAPSAAPAAPARGGAGWLLALLAAASLLT